MSITTLAAVVFAGLCACALSFLLGRRTGTLRMVGAAGADGLTYELEIDNRAGAATLTIDGRGDAATAAAACAPARRVVYLERARGGA